MATNRHSHADEATVEYERVFHHVASFGSYQKALYAYVNYLLLPLGLQFGNLLFSFGNPRFYCATPNVTCPPKKCCDNCTVYGFGGPFTSIVNETVGSGVQSRLLGNYNANSFFVGMFVGSLLSGILSDVWGRRISLGINPAIMIVSSFGSSFANSHALLTVLQFFIGASLTGTMLTIYTYGMEIIGPNKRTMAGNANELFWTVGNTLIVVCAYYIRDWRMYMRISSLPAILFLVFWKFLPETPRWLIAQGKLDEAQKVLLKYGPAKKATLINQETLRNVINEIRENQLRRVRETKRHTVIDLFRTPKLRKWTLIIGFNWFVLGLSNFGFVLYTTALAGDLYLNFALLQVVVPTLQIAPVWFILHRYGRRIPHFAILLLAGIVCLLILVIPERFSMVLTGISIAGKSLISSCWTTIYLITSESYPTILRNTALGTGSLCGRLGAMIAPSVANMAQLPGVSLTIPVIIFGVAAVCASITSLWVPETHYAPMPQTIDEAEQRKDYYGIPCCLKNPDSRTKSDNNGVSRDSDSEPIRETQL